MRRSRHGLARPRLLAIVLGVAALLGLMAFIAVRSHSGAESPPRRRVGLFTSLPILWAESADIAGLLDPREPPHWAHEALRRHGRLVPLDTLAQDGAADPLSGIAFLVMAQPRPLSPAENVALDAWVRGGGRLLLLADPMLTAPSAYALGDRRRPQDIVMISPILAHWGLGLAFDEDQQAGEHVEQVLDGPMPVNLAGRFVQTGTRRDCVPRDGGLAATCRIGAGRVVALADAALFEQGGSETAEMRRAALDRAIRLVESGD